MPLDATLESHLRTSILENCGLFFRHIEPVAALLNDRSGSVDDFFAGIQAAMAAAGNVSKILWPVGNSQRGLDLRASIGINDDSLIRDRAVRNGFEHFDERLERWSRTSRRMGQIDRYIGPRSSINGVDDGDFARWYDNQTHTLYVFDASIDFQELTRQMAELYNLLDRQRQEHPHDRRFGLPIF